MEANDVVKFIEDCLRDEEACLENARMSHDIAEKEILIAKSRVQAIKSLLSNWNGDQHGS